MQIRSGQAQVLGADHNRVTFTNMTAADAALLADGQMFKFSGESMLFFTIGDVVSVNPPIVDLTADYVGSIAFDTLTNYTITRDFTPVHGLPEQSPSDVDIRDLFTLAMRIIDALPFTGGGSGSGFTKSGTADVTAGAFTKTITPTSGAFPAPPYAVVWAANWPTWGGWSGQLTTEFVLTFGVEAPASAKVSWGVWTP